MKTGIDGSIDGQIEYCGLAASETHICDATLEVLFLALLSSCDVFGVGISSVFDTFDDIGHGA